LAAAAAAVLELVRLPQQLDLAVEVELAVHMRI
jgi:hypothetical protein